MSIIKEVKEELCGIGITNFVKYVISLSFTMFSIWSITISDNMAHIVFYIACALFGWMLCDIIFLQKIALVKRAILYSKISFFIGLTCLSFGIYNKISMYPSVIMFFGCCVFSILSNAINIPKHILESYNGIMPKSHENAFKELIYDILFEVSVISGKGYMFRIDTSKMNESEIETFNLLVCSEMKKYCDIITSTNLNNDLVFCITYHTFDNMHYCIDLLNKNIKK